MKITLHKGTLLYKNRSVVCENPIEIRGGVIDIDFIGAYTYLGGGNTTIRNVSSIGRFCSIAPNVQMGLFEHPIDHLSTSPVFWGGGKDIFGTPDFLDFFHSNIQILQDISKEVALNQNDKIEIKNDVWIGEGVFVKKGVVINDGAIVASRAVVTKDVPPYSIVAGCPAKILRYRFCDEIIKGLLDIQWWNYPLNIFSGFDFKNITIKNIDNLKRLIDGAKRADYSRYSFSFKNNVLETEMINM